MTFADSENRFEYINGDLDRIPGIVERFSPYSDMPGGLLICRADSSGEILYANSAVMEIMECYSTEQFLKITGGTWRSLASEADTAVICEGLVKWNETGITSSSKFHFLGCCPSLGRRMLDVEFFYRFIQDVTLGGLIYFFVVFTRDERDLLTDLPSMSRFLNLANSSEGKATDGSMAMVSFNLNGLKMFNEKFGIAGGDALIVSFADILKKHFGAINCSRFGEDHFYAYTPVAGLEDKIRDIFSEMSRVNDGNTLSVRAGIYIMEPDDENRSSSSACDRARIACDYERRHHESCFVYYDKKIRNEILNRDYIISHIDEALEKEYIAVYYQPQVVSQSGKPCGFEALARWIDPELGMLSPAVFIPVLDNYSLTYKLDLYIIEHVARDLVESMKRGLNVVPVSFNLSRTDFEKCDPFSEVIAIAERYNLPRELFKVEITETTVMSDINKMKVEINRFHEGGFDVLMDDFGSAYSSLSTLRDFEFDEIKIDMGFMRNFSPRSRAIIKPMVNMAKALGIHTIAEGVETQEQLDFLKSIGCEMIQGYYFGKPEPYEQAVETHRRLTRNYEQLLHRTSSMIYSKGSAKKQPEGKSTFGSFDRDELERILGCVSSLFITIIGIDLVQNSWEEYLSSYEMHKFLNQGSKDLREKLNNAVMALVKPEYHYKMIRFLDFATISARLKDCSSVSTDFQSSLDESYIRLEIFSLERNSEGNVTRILTTTRTVDPDLVTADHYKTVTHALKHIYSALVAFNLEDRTFIPYVMPIAMLERTGFSKQPYDLARNMFLENFVDDRYKEMVYRFTDLSTLRERIADKKQLYINYLNPAGEWCHLTFIPSKYVNGELVQVLAAARNLAHEKDVLPNGNIWDVYEN